MPYDPYALMNPPEKNIRGDSANGRTGSETSASLRNAALNRTPKTGANVFAAMVDRQPSPSPLAKKRRVATVGAPISGIAAAPMPRRVTGITTRPATIPGAGGLQSFGGPPSVTYYDPKTGGTTHTNPNGGATIPGAGRLQPNRFDYGYGPGVDPHFAPPGTLPVNGASIPGVSSGGFQPANLPPTVTYRGPNGEYGGGRAPGGDTARSLPAPLGGGRSSASYIPFNTQSNPNDPQWQPPRAPGFSGGLQPVPYNGNPFDPTNPGVIVTYRGPNGEYGGGQAPSPGGRPPATPSTQPVGEWESFRAPGQMPPPAPGTTTPFYGPGVQGGTGNLGGDVLWNPPGTLPPQGGLQNPMALNQPFNAPYFDQARSGGDDDIFRNRGFNPTGPALPPSSPTTPRPPATPSTQPTPPGRPPATPSTQPVNSPSVGEPFRAPWDPSPAPPGSTAPFYGPRPGGGRYESPSAGTPLNVPPMVTYGGPNGTTTNPFGGGGLPAGGGRDVAGFSPPTTPGGQPFGSNGIGRRYAQPDDPTSASGQASAGYQWFTKPDGTNEFWQVDANGKPVARVQHGQNGPTQGQSAIPWGTTSSTPASQAGGTSTSTTTGQSQAPNNTTTFDPSVLPQSDAGAWLDPVFQDTMDKMTRQLRHEGSLTGATNSGGFIPGITEKLAPVANQFAAQKGQLMFQDQQAKADRLLDKYKFDNTQQLTEWIKTHEFELQQAGIDANVLVGKYQADSQRAAAGSSAAASRYGADVSRDNAWLDFMQGMYGIDANTAMGEKQLGYNYWNSNNQYNLGLYGTDVDRENNMMRYLSDQWNLAPEWLRLILGSDPSGLIPGMEPGSTVVVK